MNSRLIETLVLEACTEGSWQHDCTQMSDAELIALGNLRNSVWRLRQGTLDLDVHADWAEFIPLMREVFAELFNRAQNSCDDFERQTALLPAIFNLRYCPTLPDDEDVLSGMDCMAQAFVSGVISSEATSWPAIHAAMNLCEATVCQWEESEDEVEYQWFRRVASEWSDGVDSGEPLESVGRAMILQNAGQLDDGVVSGLVDKYIGDGAVEVLSSLVRLCLDSSECDSLMQDRLAVALLSFDLESLSDAERWTLLASVCDLADVVF